MRTIIRPLRKARVKSRVPLTRICAAATLQTRSFTSRTPARREQQDRTTDVAEWSPISPLFEPFPRFFSPLWSDFDVFPETRMQESKLWSPRVDVYDSKDTLNIDVELPGMNKQDIKMKVKDGFLELSGERKMEKTEEDKARNFKRVERSYGSFFRRMKLPKGADVKQISANFDKGILKITIPQPQAKEEEGHEVEIREEPTSLEQEKKQEKSS